MSEDNSLIHHLVTEFLLNWRNWAINEAPNADRRFHESLGLCGNWMTYARVSSFGYSTTERGSEYLYHLISSTCSGSKYYPFGGELLFEHEMSSRTAYRNQLRLQWVDKFLEGSQ